jgi:hypothetical protein
MDFGINCNAIMEMHFGYCCFAVFSLKLVQQL